jgi:hypothetical protein
MEDKITKPEEKSTRIEIIITVLLGLATLLGATGAYFSALWGGTQHSNYIKSVTETNHANTTYLEALNEQSNFNMDDLKDDLIYAEWKNNYLKGDKVDADYYFLKLSEGLQKDLTDNPNDISEYEKEQKEKEGKIESRFVESYTYQDIADSLMKVGETANKNGDDFTLTTVLFTVVLFFLGLASLKTKEKIQKVYVIFAAVVFIASLIKMLTIPFPPF